MRIFNIDYTKVSKVIDKIDTVISMNSIRNFAVSKETRKEIKTILQEFLLNDIFKESAESKDGYVLYEEALAAIEDEKESQKKIVDGLVESVKQSNAGKCSIKGKRPDGYIFEISVQQDGIIPYDEFSSEQIDVIRKYFTACLRSNKSDQSFLDIINVCLAKQDKGEYSDIEEFIKTECQE